MSVDTEYVIDALLERHGKTFAGEIGIRLGPDDDPTASPLFQMLCAAALMSTRIDSEIAVASMKQLIDRGWITPEKMAESTWDQRVEALSQGNYDRYREKTATFLGEIADILNEKYEGDLRNLREQAQRDPNRERELLKEFPGMGDVGVDIFFRAVQLHWEELFPFLDQKGRQAAERLGLPKTPANLLKLVKNRNDWPRVVSALVRMDLAGDHDDVCKLARDKAGQG